jgi:hypothetical protein
MTIREQIIQAVFREIENPTLAVTEQYLQIHDLVQVNGLPEIARIDLDERDDIAIAYLPIREYKFYLAVYVKIAPETSVINIGTENGNRVYLRAISDTISFEEITAMSILKATEGWNKGDLKKHGKAWQRYNCAIYEPNPEPDSFEDKLRKLIDYLEQDCAGVAWLVERTDAYIQVDCDIHNGNGLIGGPFINKGNIKRLSAMNLEIAFSQYVTGNPFQ